MAANINKIVDEATEEELGDMLILVSKKLSAIRRERVKGITFGSIVTYDEDKTGEVVSINAKGVLISSPELKKRKNLDWTEIQSFVQPD